MNLLLGTARGQSTDDGSPTVSALAPFKGTSTATGASYKVNESLELNVVIRTTFGDAIAEYHLQTRHCDNKGTRVSIGTKIVSNLFTIYKRLTFMWAFFYTD